MMAEIYGRATGYCKGKGGSMHIADLDVGILGANGIVGGGIPIAVGAAIGARVKKEDRVTLCFFGDGASNTGSFHESLNLAAVLRLPVVFVCENNRWAVSTPVCYSLPVENVADRAASYGMPGAVADGSDPLAVYEAVREAAARARRGEGPTLVEAKTYRWEGHFRGDPETYRSREEVNDWRQNRDPLRLFAARLKEEGIAGDEDLAVVRGEVGGLVSTAVAFAEQSPLPPPELLYADVYA
jgi:TPP-dependent pyruvate/acetoin dehydrogenase alpha subunit